MAEGKPEIGTIVWCDLTVANAEAVREFYAAVVGWKAQTVDMGGYADFNMLSPASEEAEVGICHARGTNEGIPSQWLLYVVVADLEASMARCRELGGRIVREARPLGKGRFCILQDPAGAVCALYEAPK